MKELSTKELGDRVPKNTDMDSQQVYEHYAKVLNEYPDTIIEDLKMIVYTKRKNRQSIHSKFEGDLLDKAKDNEMEDEFYDMQVRVLDRLADKSNQPGTIPPELLTLEDVVKPERITEFMEKTTIYYNTTSKKWTIKPGKLSRLLIDLYVYGYLKEGVPTLTVKQKIGIAKNTFGVDLKPRTTFNASDGHVLS